MRQEARKLNAIIVLL